MIITQWWPRMKWLDPITIFNYVRWQEDFMEPTWPVSDMCILISLLVVSTVLGHCMVGERDLPL